MDPDNALRFLAVALGCLIAMPPAGADPQTSRDGARRGRRVVAGCEASAGSLLPGVRLTLLTRNGGHLAWSARAGLVAFDRRAGAGGYFQLWTMKADGSGERCLSCGRPGLPRRHVGQPAWHPDGIHIVFQAQKESTPRSVDNQSVPGGGILNDLYLMTSDGARIWKIHEVPDVVSRESPGVLHPHFSHDGKRLLWAERLGSGGGAFGRWVLKLADFSFQRGTPRLSNIRDLPPDPARAFYESHGFSPDDSRIIFSSTRDGNLEIYTLRLEDHAVVRLTDDSAWDEHSHFSPDGKWIVWMSSRGLRFQARPRFELETEFWLMRADGSCPRRLTGMHDPSSPHFREGFVVAADVAWAEDGQSLFALFITGRPETNRRGSGLIARLALPPGWDAE